jgi:hypothetical protein
VIVKLRGLAGRAAYFQTPNLEHFQNNCSHKTGNSSARQSSILECGGSAQRAAATPLSPARRFN